jgi:hypothetical protein
MNKSKVSTIRDKTYARSKYYRQCSWYIILPVVTVKIFLGVSNTSAAGIV